MSNPLDTRNFSIDKAGWKKVKFGDVVCEPKESIKGPCAKGIEHVVGLDHIDSERIHLRRSASIEESTTFTKKFSKGDVLFGRRRAYLKKAAFAPFNGICSGDITVMRASDDLLPELLPFLVNNDKFFDWAVKHSAGGLSPRVKFKDLAKYEFLLPPKEHQSLIAELLWAMDAVVENDLNSLIKSEKLKESYFINSIFDSSEELDVLFGRRKSKYPVQQLGDLISQMQYGISESLSLDTGIPVLRMNNLQDGELDISDLKYFDFSGADLEKYRLDKGDVLFNRTNSFDLVGKVSLFDQDEDYSFASYLLRIKTNAEKLDSRFLNFYLNLPIGMSKIRKYRTPGVSQSNINAQNLKQVPVPTPGTDLQKEVMAKVDAFDRAGNFLKEKIKASKVLQKSLISKVF